MAINWNREVTGKDVKKFFNQEIKLGEINYSKCLQVSLLVFALGIVPAFTYGLVLGTLDEQRVALMGEVGSLKAEVITATKETQIISDARASSERYASNTPIVISFNSATSTGVVRFDLYDGKSKLLQTLGTTTTRTGSNTFTFRIATSTLTTNDLFAVRISLLNPQRVITTGKFEVKQAVRQEQLKLSIEPGNLAQGVQTNVSDDASDDQGIYSITYNVSNNGDKTVYIEIGSATRGTVENNTGANFTIEDAPSGYAATTSGSVSAELIRVSGGVVSGNFVKIEPGVKATFRLSVYFDPALTALYRAQLYSVNYATTATDATSQQVVVPAENFQTSSVSILDFASQPIGLKDMTIEKVSTATIVGDPALSQSDIGIYRFKINVSAGDSDVYIASSSISSLDGFRVASLGPELAGKFVVNIIGKTNTKDTANFRFIPRGTTRSFDVVVLAEPLRTGEFSVGSMRLYWGGTQDTLLKNYRDYIGQYRQSPGLFLNAR